MKMGLRIFFSAVLAAGLLMQKADSRAAEISETVKRQPDEIWASQNGWEQEDAYTYFKTAEGVNYRLSRGKNPYDEECGRDAYWYLSVSYSPDASGKVEIRDSMDGFCVTAVNKDAFRNNSAMTECVLPEGIEYIGVSAFMYCKSLEKVTLPESLKFIDAGAFWGSEKLEELTIPIFTEKIGRTSFWGYQGKDHSSMGLKSLTFEGNAPEVLYLSPYGDSFMDLENTQVNYYSDTEGWDEEIWTELPKLYGIQGSSEGAESKVDKKDLRTLLIAARAAETENFTADSVEALDEALIYGEAVSKERTASAEKVSGAVEKFNRAFQNLKKKETKPEVSEIFRDVSPEAWYADAVSCVYEKGLMKGYCGNFMPETAMSRAMIVQTLYNREGRPEIRDRSACQIFSDLKGEEWYIDAVCWAYSEGIANGDLYAKKFHGEDPVTREETAVFLYRYAQYCGLEIFVPEKGEKPENMDKVSSYASEAVQWAVNTGILSGMRMIDLNGTIHFDLAPQKTADRAQMAMILRRFECLFEAAE